MKSKRFEIKLEDQDDSKCSIDIDKMMASKSLLYFVATIDRETLQQKYDSLVRIKEEMSHKLEVKIEVSR